MIIFPRTRLSVCIVSFPISVPFFFLGKNFIVRRFVAPGLSVKGVDAPVTEKTLLLTLKLLTLCATLARFVSDTIFEEAFEKVSVSGEAAISAAGAGVAVAIGVAVDGGSVGVGRG